METDNREYAKKVSKEINYVDLFKDANDITLENLWMIFAGITFKDRQVGAVQYRETKKAFIIGFMECFRLMSDISDRFDENKASAIFTQLSREGNLMIDHYLNSTLAKSDDQN